MPQRCQNELPEPASQPSPAVLVRAVRHELGDLLQKLYATVAIVQPQLPVEWEMERRHLIELKERARDCKEWLDAVHDLVCPVEVAAGSVDVAELAAERVAAARTRCPQAEIQHQATGPAWARANRPQLARVVDLLLTDACAAGARRILCRTTVLSSKAEVEWSATDDGPKAPPELEAQWFDPSASTRAGRSAMRWALARKLVALQGGQFSASQGAGAGLTVSVVLASHPAAAPRSNGGCHPAAACQGASADDSLIGS